LLPKLLIVLIARGLYHRGLAAAAAARQRVGVNPPRPENLARPPGGASAPVPIVDAAAVAEIASAIARAGAFAFDLEFVSEGRYVPELALLQVAWGEAAAPSTALIDCVAVDPRPVLALIGDPAIETVAHAARQDLGLIASRFGIRAAAFWDTQIAAAFVGQGDQIGYGRAVEELLGVRLDKSSQFTRWLERPLSAAQLRYALDDVRHLPAVWRELRERLERAGRLAWVVEESAALAAIAAEPPAPELAYQDVKGWRNLRGRAAAAVVALASWRETTALRDNQPPSWILPDQSLLELARQGATSDKDLRKIRGIGGGIAARWGAEMIDVLEAAKGQPPPAAEELAGQPSARAALWGSIVLGIVGACADAAGIAVRHVATRSDADALARWCDERGRDAGEPPMPLLQGWRREIAGAAALAWLRGDAALEASRDGAAAVRLVPRARS
jgi:ribonuclease D